MTAARQAREATALYRFGKWPSPSQVAVTWSGRLPSHWSAKKLKYVASIRMSNVDKHSVEGEHAVRLCNYVDVYRNHQITKSIQFMEATASIEQIRRFELQDDDVLITKDSETPDDIAIPSVVVERLPGVICGYHLALLRSDRARLTGRFLAWVLRSSFASARFAIEANGITRFALDRKSIGDLSIPLPPFPEQIEIANFLDSETAKIDALIDRKERLVARLRESWAVVVNELIARGLDRSSRLIESGSVWLRQVPANWRLAPLGSVLSKITYGFTNPMPVADDGPLMITANDIGDGEILAATARKTTTEAYRTLLTEKSRPRAGDLLITKDGSLGRVAIADGRAMCINQSVALLRVAPGKADSEFLAYALLARAYADRIAFEAGGTTIKHIYISRLAKMPIAFPSIEEQETISKIIRERRARNASVIAEIESGIEKLREYRLGLISAVVAGNTQFLDKASV